MDREDAPAESENVTPEVPAPDQPRERQPDRGSSPRDAIEDALSSIEARATSLNRYAGNRTATSGEEASAPSGVTAAQDALAEVRRQGERTEQLLGSLSGLVDGLRADIRSAAEHASATAAAPTAAPAGEPVRRIGELREEIDALRGDVGEMRIEIHAMRQDIAAVVGASADVDVGQGLESLTVRLDQSIGSLSELVESVPEQDQAVIDRVVSAFKAEARAAVAPVSAKLDELARQISASLGGGGPLGEALAMLVEEIKRLRRRIAVGSPGGTEESTKERPSGERSGVERKRTRNSP